MRRKTLFRVTDDWIETVCFLNDESIGQFVRAVLLYAKTGKRMEVPEGARAVYEQAVCQLDEKEAQRVRNHEAMVANGKKGGRRMWKNAAKP